jgi:hypothetical protein
MEKKKNVAQIVGSIVAIGALAASITSLVRTVDQAATAAMATKADKKADQAYQLLKERLEWSERKDEARDRALDSLQEEITSLRILLVERAISVHNGREASVPKSAPMPSTMTTTPRPPRPPLPDKL